MKKLPKCANGQIFDHFYSVSECEATRRKTNSSVSKHTHTGIERARGGRRQKTIFTKIVFLFIIGLVAMSATLISDFVERIFRRNFFSRFRFLLLSLLLFFLLRSLLSAGDSTCEVLHNIIVIVSRWQRRCRMASSTLDSR